MPRDTFAAGTSARYYKHTAAGGTVITSDGKPMSANVWMHLQQNVHHLRNESGCQLVGEVGPGAALAKTGWASLDETDQSARTEQWYEISWSREMCRRYGPHKVTRDNDGGSGSVYEESRPRRYKFAVWGRCDGANTLRVYFAVTANPQPPTEGYVAFSRQTTTSATDVLLSDTLTIEAGGNVPRTSSLPTATGSGSTVVEEVWLWIGMRITAGSGSVWSHAVWEVDG